MRSEQQEFCNRDVIEEKDREKQYDSQDRRLLVSEVGPDSPVFGFHIIFFID